MQHVGTVQAVQQYVLAIPCSMPVWIRETYTPGLCQVRARHAGFLKKREHLDHIRS